MIEENLIVKVKLEYYYNDEPTQKYVYEFDEKKHDIDLINNILTLMDEPNSSINKEHIKKQIDEI